MSGTAARGHCYKPEDFIVGIICFMSSNSIHFLPVCLTAALLVKHWCLPVEDI